jgi:hypothetical protein
MPVGVLVDIMSRYRAHFDTPLIDLLYIQYMKMHDLTSTLINNQSTSTSVVNINTQVKYYLSTSSRSRFPSTEVLGVDHKNGVSTVLEVTSSESLLVKKLVKIFNFPEFWLGWGAAEEGGMAVSS